MPEIQPARPGERLREIRVRAGLTTRQVDQMSRAIAINREDEDYLVSHARLVQIENGESTPSIYKLYSLGAVYGCGVNMLLRLYVDVDKARSEHLRISHQNTHLLEFDPPDASQHLSFPVRFDPGFNPQKSELISRLVEVWGEVPMELLQGLNLRKGRWGLIGQSDYTMYPLLRPGSLVQIDDKSKPAPPATYRTEYDRPIYFVELRDGYLCSWCDFRKGRLFSIPHPLSPVSSRDFAYPQEAEIVGRVTAIAARLVSQNPSTSAGTATIGTI